jgi:cytochrome d ubiquinol oxidase subunit II
MMETIWFLLLAGALTAYSVLDGFDLGVGILSPFVAKTDAEKRQLYRSVGPVWDGNEVWLLASGGTMFLAFPKLLATGLSGFYLPIMLVLWLLFVRALSIELRHQLDDAMWTSLWDALFFVSSLLLVVLFGAALGNVLRGVTFDGEGRFFAPLWTTFSPEAPVGALDWYTVAIALEATVVIAHHGALWLEWRTDGETSLRAGRLGARLFWVSALGALLATALSLAVQPRLLTGLSERPWVLACALPIGAIVLIPGLRKRGQSKAAFLASCTHIAGLLLAAALSLYPWLLPATDAGAGLTIENAKTADYSLRVGLWWWLPALALVLFCQRFVYAQLPSKFSIADDVHH